MKNCKSILGNKILEIREIKGISQQQLATKAGLSKALITHIETGKRYPSDKALQKIIEALEITEDEILTEEVKNEYIKKLAEEAKPSEIIRAYRQIMKND
jgi:transcriptional regulator with XRE-family HTH domain